MLSNLKLKVLMASNQRLNIAAILTIILFNIVYILATIISHANGYPNVLRCFLSVHKHPCRIPPTATSYNYVLGIVITKTVILPIVLLTELVVGLAIAFNGKRPAMTNKLLVSLLKAFAIWQVLVFIQITVVLVSIPLIVLMFISPASVLLSAGGVILCYTMIAFILTTIPLPNTCKSHSFHSCISITETLIITAVVFAAFGTYYTIIQEGVSMDGVKGYLLSLAPTIPVSILLWFIKKKYFGQNLRYTQLEKKDALSEEETRRLLSPSQETDLTQA